MFEKQSSHRHVRRGDSNARRDVLFESIVIPLQDPNFIEYLEIEKLLDSAFDYLF